MLLIAEGYVLEGKWRVHGCLRECYQVHGSGSQLGKPRSGEHESLLPYILYHAVTCSAHQTQGCTDGKQTKRVYSEGYAQCIAAFGIELNDNGLFGVARRV